MALLLACEPFTTVEQIEAYGCDCTLDELVTAGIDINDIIDAASDLVYLATHGAITGRCTSTVRPCASDSSCGRYGDACRCCRLDAIPLRGELPEVTQVKIDGVALASTEYGVLDGSKLIRKSTGARPPSWPGCQSLWRPDTEEGTFSFTYDHGVLPYVGIMAATELACDLAKGSLTGTSKLPPGTIGAIMDGVSVTLDANQIAMFPWMMRLAGAYPYSPKPVVWSPEVDDGWALHTIS